MAHITPTSIFDLPDAMYEAHSIPFHMSTAMLNKGNILQHRNNSAGLTKKQKYAQIAHRASAERRTTFASQTQRVTDPNSSSIGRIYADIGQYAVPVLKRDQSRVRRRVPGGCAKSLIQVGGNLVAKTRVDECTGALVSAPDQLGEYPCVSTRFSGIRGSGEETLCWPKNIATWIPKNNSVMVVEANRHTFDDWTPAFDVPTPFITSAVAPNSDPTVTTVVWTINNMRAYISSYSVYVNGALARTFKNTGVHTTQVTASVGDYISMVATVRLINAAVHHSPMSYVYEVEDDTPPPYPYPDPGETFCPESISGVLSNDVILEVNALVLAFQSNALNLEITYSDIVDTYNTLSVKLHNLKEIYEETCDSYKVVVLYENMLKIVYYGMRAKNNWADANAIADNYQNDSNILHNQQLLQEYIDSLNAQSHQKDLSVSTSMGKIQIKPHYAAYIQKYGMPENFDFDPEKLAEFM